MFIVAGPEQVLGFNPSSGEYKIISTGKGDLSGATVEEVLDFKRGPFNRLAGKALQEGFEPLDISNMEPTERVRLRGVAEGLMGGTAPMAHISNSEKLNTKIKDATKELKKIFGGAKLPGILGIFDLMGMKKEYDDIKKGESLINKLIPTEKEFSKQVFKDGGVIDIFDTD